MINIYTDGACKKNFRNNGIACGDGGWAYIILEQEEGEDMKIIMSNSDYKSGTTNQEMEIIAVAEAFESLVNYKVGVNVILYSDSAYLINCLKDKWYDKWILNGWLNSKKKPVENRDAWERAINASKKFDVVFHHINRNSAKFITLVDGMAKKASKKETNQERSKLC